MADFFFNEGGWGTLPYILAMALAGVIVACIAMLWQIKVPGKIVRTLDENGAHSPEEALDAAALGYKSERKLKRRFSPNGALHKYVVVTFEEGAEGVYLKAKYHLDPQRLDAAQMRYKKKNATVPALITAIIAFSIVAVIMGFIIPDLVQMLKNFIATFTQEQ